MAGRISSLFLCCLMALAARGQFCPSPLLQVPDTVCLNSGFSVSATALGSFTSPKWSFCGDDVQGQVSLVNSIPLPMVQIAGGIEVVEEAGQKLVFVTSRLNARIYRLRFPGGFAQPPLIDSLILPPNALEFIEALRVERNDTLKTMVVQSIVPYNPTNPDTITLARLDFGTSFLNTPTAQTLPVLKSEINLPSGLAVFESGDTLFYLSGNFNPVGSSINGRLNRFYTIKGSGVYTTLPFLTLPKAGTVGITIAEECPGDYLLYVSGTLGDALMYRFRGSLASFPSVVTVPPTPDLFSQLAFFSVNGKVQAIGAQLNRGMKAFQLEDQFGQMIFQPLNAYSSFGPNYPATQCNASQVFYDDTAFYVLQADVSNSRLSILKMESPCAATAALVPTASAASSLQDTAWQVLEFQVRNGLRRYLYTDSVFVRKAPTAEFASTGNCFGSETRLLDRSIGYGVNQWQWYQGANLISTAPSAVYQAPSTGNFSFSLVSGNICGKDSISRNIAFGPSPLANFQAPDSVCLFNTFQPQDLSNSANGIASYFWRIPGSDSSASAAPSLEVRQSGPNSILLEVLDSLGCKGDTSKVIFGIEAPQVSYQLLQNCVGDSTRLSNTSTGLGPLSTLWILNGQDSLFQTNVAIVFPDSGQQVVRLQVANSIGCENELLDTFRVYQKPLAGFEVQSFCKGQVGQAIDNSLLGDDVINQWVWRLIDPQQNVVDSAFVNNPTFSLADTGLYRLFLQVQTPVGCRDSLSRSVFSFSAPVLDFDFVQACQGLPVQFINQSQVLHAQDSLSQFFWNFGATGLPGNTSNLSNPSFTYPALGQYIVNLVGITARGCEGSISDTLDVLRSPNTGFTVSFACEDEALRFQALSVFGSDTLSNWEWVVAGSGQRSADTLPQFVFDQAGPQILRLMGSSIDGCLDSTSLQVDVKARPNAQFSSSATQGVVPLTVQVINPALPGYRYRWQLDGLNRQDSLSAPAFLLTQPGERIISLFLQSAEGCKDTFSLPVTAIAQLPEAVIELVNVSTINGKWYPNVFFRNTGNVVINNFTLQFNTDEKTRLQRIDFDVLIGNLGGLTDFQADFDRYQRWCAQVVELNDTPYQSNTECLLSSDRLTILGVRFRSGLMELDLHSPLSAAAEVRLYDASGRLIMAKEIFLLVGNRSYELGTQKPISGLGLIEMNTGGRQLRAKVMLGD